LRLSRLRLAKFWGHTMPRRCTVCAHPKVEAIDMALVAGEPYRSVANRYESLSQAAVQRHEENHLPATLSKAKEAREVSRADDLLASVRGLHRRALSILGKAEEAGELRTALSAIREARGNLELLAKLLGELDERPVVNLNVSPEWLELRAVIVGALEPYTEARGAVLRAIEGAGNGRG
jgi:transposase-like protein